MASDDKLRQAVDHWQKVGVYMNLSPWCNFSASQITNIPYEVLAHLLLQIIFLLNRLCN